jgi:hypothetical protein
MEEDSKGHSGLDSRGGRSGRVIKARKQSPGVTQGFGTGKVLPFLAPDRKPPAAEAMGQDPTRVQELKTRIKNGQYRIFNLRLAEKMIREDLIEDLACRKRNPEKANR